MAPSNFLQLIRKAASSRYGATDLLLLLIVLSTLSASLRPSVLAGGGYKEGPLLSLLLSPRFSYHLCLYLCGAFVIYLIFYYPANKKSYHSRLYILSAALLFLPARHLLPCFFNTAIPAFLTLPWRIQVGVGVSVLTALILRPGFTSLHLVATGLILVLVLAVQSLLPFLPAALLPPTTVLSVLLFLYYLPAMPNFILSFAPIIRRTMAAILLLFLVLTPQLVIFFRLLAAQALMFFVTAQTRKVNFAVRLLHLHGSIDYIDADWFINLLSWSFFALYLICNAAKIYIHPLA